MAFSPSAQTLVASYGPAFAAIYDEAVATAAMPAILVGVRQGFARFRIQPRSIADVGCGTGWLLAALAAPDRQLYGVDSAPAMLAQAARRLTELRPRGTGLILIRQDLRELSLPKPVDLILCTFATLNYLSESHLSRAFAAFRRNLRPGGWLIFDFIALVRSEKARPVRYRQVVSAGGQHSIWKHTIDPERGRTETRILFLRAGREPAILERHVQQWHRTGAVMALLARHGFSTVSVRPLGAGGPSHWTQVVARASREQCLTNCSCA